MFATLITFICSASAVYAECTPEQMQQKAVEFSTQVQALAQKDAARAQTLMQEFATKTQEMQGKDMDALCKYYDEMIEKTK